MMLSARGEEYDKLYGFDLGIDDYVVKPFSPKEVIARINAIIKRNNSDKVSNRFNALKGWRLTSLQGMLLWTARRQLNTERI